MADIVAVLFQDDFALPAGAADSHVEPISRASALIAASTQAMLGLMQPGINFTTNRFADAFIDPRYNAINNANDETAAVAHSRPTDGTFASVGVGGERDSATLETDSFWVVYLSTAYEDRAFLDHDPNSEGVFVGYSLGDVGLVFTETLLDIGGTFVNTIQMTAIHELGHQLALANPDMSVGGEQIQGNHRPLDLEIPDIMVADLSAADIGDTWFFHPHDIAFMRLRVRMR